MALLKAEITPPEPGFLAPFAAGPFVAERLQQGIDLLRQLPLHGGALFLQDLVFLVAVREIYLDLGSADRIEWDEGQSVIGKHAASEIAHFILRGACHSEEAGDGPEPFHALFSTS